MMEAQIPRYGLDPKLQLNVPPISIQVATPLIQACYPVHQVFKNTSAMQRTGVRYS
jgi:hypothetical protein